MEKKLVTVGNSVALVLDKALRQSLGIKPTTLVRVMTDGKRLIIEPSGERPAEIKRTVDVTERMRAVSIASELLKTYGLGNDLFACLTCGWPGRMPRLRANVYRFWLEGVDWERLTEAELRVIRRFDIVYSTLRTRQASWQEAIDKALAAEPFDPEDPSEKSVGLPPASVELPPANT